MEFYDKFADKFQDISNIKNTAISKEKSGNYLEPSKENVLVEYDVVTLTRLYLKVLMIWFHKVLKLISLDAAIMS